MDLVRQNWYNESNGEVALTTTPSNQIIFKWSENKMSDSILTKICSKCKQSLSVTAFHKSSRTRDGLQFKCYECDKAMKRDFYNRNKEKCREKVRAAAALHPEWRKQRGEKRKLQPEKLEHDREYARQQYWENVEAKREYSKWYSKTFALKCRIAAHRYRKNNRHKGRIRNLSYATMKKDGGVSLTETQWLLLCAAFGEKCLSCEQIKRLTIDHIVPITKGGATDLENAQPLCLSCNASKSNRVILDYRLKSKVVKWNEILDSIYIGIENGG